MGIFDKGVKKTNEGFFKRLSRAVIGKSRVDDDVLDAIEEALVSSDMGVETTLKIVESLEDRVERDKFMSMNELVDMLRDEIARLLDVDGAEDVRQGALPFDLSKKPYVILVVGVNGVGIVRQVMGSDPASVAYDTVKSAVAKNADVVIIDTAGRLHNRINLMNELTKIRNVIRKVIPDAPHEVMLVLDGSTGQNAYHQAQEFSKATDVTSLAVTKLDGSAKGGVVIGIVDQMKIPIKFIGIGEGIDDLKVFDKKEFAASLFNPEDIAG